MKASELRIGNLVKDGSIFEKVPVYHLVNISHLKHLIIDKDSYKPIPLTEEWLLKFGFELVSNYNKEKIVFLFKFGLSDDCFTVESNLGELMYFRYNGNFISVKYVHQLQNLYFALTSEELQLNL